MLLGSMRGDATRFMRRDVVEAEGRIITPIEDTTDAVCSPAMFLSNSSRSDDVPSGRRRGSRIGVAPLPGPPGSAVRVDANVRPTNAREISPDIDPRLQYHERSPTGMRHRDVVCDHIDGSPPRTPHLVLE
jgi:hypothetical protein